MNILQIDSSVLGDNSVSRSLTASIVADLVAKNPGAKVTVRDLDKEAPAHLGNHLLPVLGGPKDGLNAVQQAELERTETFLAEFMAADVLVIGVPQYNFSIPSQLKAWIDRIAQAGRTFRYTANGPEGLAVGKRVIVVSSRGGVRQDANTLDLHEVTIDAVLRSSVSPTSASSALTVWPWAPTRAKPVSRLPARRSPRSTTPRCAPPPEPDSLSLSV